MYLTQIFVDMDVGMLGEVGVDGGVGDLVDDLDRNALKGVVLIIDAIVGEVLISVCLLSTPVLTLLVSKLRIDLNFSVSFLKSIPE